MEGMYYNALPLERNEGSEGQAKEGEEVEDSQIRASNSIGKFHTEIPHTLVLVSASPLTRVMLSLANRLSACLDSTLMSVAALQA